MELSASVIICTRNRRNDLINCLQSLSKQTKLPQELIIVDSSDQSLVTDALFKKAFASEKFPHTRCTYVHTKPGLTSQRNQGIKRAGSDIIYFFDDDVLLSPTYLYEMQKAFQIHSDYAAGMGTISNSNKNASKRYRWFRRFFLLPHEKGSGLFTWSGMPTHPYGILRFKRIEVLGGCCMAFRKEILQRHSFDETLCGYSYLEDADIARRISLEKSLFFNPHAQLQHNESPIARDRVVDTSAMFVYNYSYLFFKNFYPFHRLKLCAYIWSLFGLLLQGIIVGDSQQFQGFFKGLFKFIKRRRSK